MEKDLDIKLQSDAFAFIRLGREAQAQEMPGLIFCARGDSVANKDRAAAEVARLLALQDFTRFGEGLKCVQVRSRERTSLSAIYSRASSFHLVV